MYEKIKAEIWAIQYERIPGKITQGIINSERIRFFANGGHVKRTMPKEVNYNALDVRDAIDYLRR